MIINDTRKMASEYPYMVSAYDKFMSGWGMAKGGKSVAVWCCYSPQDQEKIVKWLRNRSEMRYIKTRFATKWRPKNAAHVSYYAVDSDHPALKA